MSKPVQVYLDDAEFERLETWSKARGWTKSQAVRAAVRALTGTRATDPLLELQGMVDGLPADLSANFSRYLEATFVAEPQAVFGARARRPRARVRR